MHTPYCSYTQSTVKPFGRAVYLGQATYPLLPHWIWPIFNIASEATLSAFHLTPTLALVQVCMMMHSVNTIHVLFDWCAYRFVRLQSAVVHSCGSAFHFTPMLAHSQLCLRIMRKAEDQEGAQNLPTILRTNTMSCCPQVCAVLRHMAAVPGMEQH
eukprot:1141625-Pelagomonas_calceolata.AAC.4